MFRRIAMVAGAALTLLVVTMMPAHATGGAYTTDHHGSVWFESYGEIFTVNDWTADGAGVRGEIDVQQPGQGGQPHWYRKATVYNGNGAAGAAKTADLSIAERTNVRYRACLAHRSNTASYHCGAWHYDKA